MGGCRGRARFRSSRAFDHLGPFARNTADLALRYDVMQGADPDDPVCADRPRQPVTPLLSRGIDGLRIAVAGGYFRKGASPEDAGRQWISSPGRSASTREIEIPEAERARSAAYVITATEGAALHLDRLRTRAKDFDPAVRDRLIAGAMVPAALVNHAQKFRRWYQSQVLEAVRRASTSFSRRRRRASLRRSDSRHSCSTASRCRCGRTSASTPSRFRSSACRWWQHQCRCSPCRLRFRSSPHPGARTSRLRVAHALEQAGVAQASRPNI